MAELQVLGLLSAYYDVLSDYCGDLISIFGMHFARFFQTICLLDNLQGAGLESAHLCPWAGKSHCLTL